MLQNATKRPSDDMNGIREYLLPCTPVEETLTRVVWPV